MDKKKNIYNVATSGRWVFNFKKGCDEPIDEDVESRLWTTGKNDISKLKDGYFQVNIHGFASEEGPPGFNEKLACARAYAARKILLHAGVSLSQIGSLISHGATPGDRVSHRSVVLKIVRIATQARPPKKRRVVIRIKIKFKRAKRKRRVKPEVIIRIPKIRLPRISWPSLRDIKKKIKRGSDLIKKIRKIFPGGILFDRVTGDLIFQGIGALTSLSSIVLGLTVATNALIGGISLSVAKWTALVKMATELEQILKELEQLRQLNSSPPAPIGPPPQDAGVPVPAGVPDPDPDPDPPRPDPDDPDPKQNDRGCKVETIAMQFGRYPCHGAFAASLSGVGREIRVTPPGSKKGVDFDAMDHGKRLYEVKTGYGWMVRVAQNKQPIPKEKRLDRIKFNQKWLKIKQRFQTQAATQQAVASKCGYPLTWYFNDKAVRDYFDPLIQPRTVYQQFKCDKDSDEKSRGISWVIP